MLAVMMLAICAEAWADVEINETNFPDDLFRNYVSGTFDKDSNGTLSNAEIATVTRMDALHSSRISSLKGIEHFTALMILNCYKDELTSLNVRKNAALETLRCSYNQLKTLDVSRNTALRILYCDNNQFSAIDVSGCSVLSELSCSFPIKDSGEGFEFNLIDFKRAYNLDGDYDSSKSFYAYSELGWIFSSSTSQTARATFDVASSIMYFPKYKSEKLSYINFYFKPTAVDRPTMRVMVYPSSSETEDPADFITISSLPDCSTDIPYTYSLTESESSSAVWTLISGDLPDGLTLSSDGTISGTPSTAGTFSFTVQAQSGSATESKLFTINVTFSPVRAPKIKTDSLPDGFINSPYGQKLTASGTSTGLTTLTWSADNLPDGFTLSKSGYLSGTPKIEGTFTFTVQAANSVNYDRKTLTLKISAAPSHSKPSITTSSPHTAGTGEQYTCQLMASGTPPFTWAVKGKLPDGLSINDSGLITATPSKKGKKKITVTASNDFGKDTKKITLNVYDLPVIVTETLKNATVAKKYNASFKAKGTAPLTWEFEGYLPDGLKIDEKRHKISGTPTKNTAGEIRLTVSNSAGELSRVFTMKADAIVPVIKTKKLKDGTYGKSYNSAVKVKGTAPITLSLSGSLPEGLSFNNKSGSITGTPIEVCTDRKIVITASNMGVSADKEYSLTIKAVAPKITTKSLANATQGTAYSAQLEATGTPAITWSASGLPAGLSISQSGEISGTPTESGKFTVKITAANSAKSAKKSYKLNVTANSTSASNKSPSSITVNNSQTHNISVNENDGVSTMLPGNYAAKDSLPVNDGLIVVYEFPEISSIVEFFDENGAEIDSVPESRNVVVSVWFNAKTIYNPALAVKPAAYPAE